MVSVMNTAHSLSLKREQCDIIRNIDLDKNLLRHFAADANY
jgi:hypothetical protein